MPDEKKDNAEEEKEKKPAPEELTSQTQHSVTVGGEEIPYTATAGTFVIKEEQDTQGEEPKATASIFYIAYTKNDVADPASRPITFSFNGGPGSSSVWLHMGVLGPRRVDVVDKDEKPIPPPYSLTDNEYSLLDATDLVFIDPVSTGYSRSAPGEKPDQFHNIKKDIESVGEFIRLFVTRNKRWASPKFLVGESYGTTRAAGLSGHLQERYGLFLNGIMLVSSVLDFQTLLFNPGNDLPHILFLPSYAAAAWYHGRLEKSLQKDLRKILEEAKEFALGEYALAMLKGDALAGEERKNIVEKLARYTGLSRDYVERTDLRINIHRFTKELLREEGATVGRLDARFKGVDRDSAGETGEYDPSLSAIMGPFTATFNDYVRRELAFESDLPYEILTGRVQPWSFEDFQNRYVNVAETLRSAIAQNPSLKVMVANGYYDLATPFLATEFTFNHLGLAPHLRENISMTYYEAGHMIYIHRPSLAGLKKDLAGFVRGAG